MKAPPPPSPRRDILHDVASYYTARLTEHGATARGVDWNGDESQSERFRQLSKIIVSDAPFSLNDVGCGYGAMLPFLDQRYPSVDYYGCDVSAPMVETARREHAGRPGARFAVEVEPSRVADYGVASGIFNVRLERSDTEWLAYTTDMLDAIARTSRLGFAFNCLTTYSDAHKMRNYLYYANPAMMFDLCKTRYSRHVALLHDYGLYEFTVLVRMEA